MEQASAILRVPLRVLTGEEEAYYAGMATLAAFSDAVGVCGDLGGGSLELARLDGDKPTHRISLPLGHLRMADHIAQGDDVGALIQKTLAPLNWLGRL